MPLRDFSCVVCARRFEAVTSASRTVECPDCLSACDGSASPYSTEVEVEARKQGVALGRRAREGDELEQYGRQYGSEAAANLLGDLWVATFPPRQQLEALARDRGVDPELAGDAFADGYLAACGDVYDDDDVE